MTPVTRKEKYLANIAGDNVAIPTPVTREEMYLNEIANKKDYLHVTYTKLNPTDVYGYVNVTYAELADAIQSGKHISISIPGLSDMIMTTVGGSVNANPGEEGCEINGFFVDTENNLLVNGTLTVLYDAYNENYGTAAVFLGSYYSLTRVG